MTAASSLVTRHKRPSLTRSIAASLAFTAPLTVVIAGQPYVGSPGLFIGILDGLLAAWLLVAVPMRARIASEARPFFVAVGALGTVILLSTLYGLVDAGQELTVRGGLLLANLVFPYFWFLAGGPQLASRSYFAHVQRWLARGCVTAAVLQLTLVGSIVLRDGAAAWITLANSGTSNQNVVGILMVVGTAVVLPGRVFLNPASRRAALVLFFLTTAWVFSRSSYIALAAVYLLYFLQSGKRMVAAIGVAVLATAGLQFVPKLIEAPLARITYTTEKGELDPSSRMRIELWKTSLTAVAQHPLLGIGFGRPVAELQGDPGLEAQRLFYSHNYFLTMAAQTGLLGLCGALAVFALSFRLAWKARLRGGNSVLLATSAIVVSSMFGEPLLVSPFLATFLIVVLDVTVPDEARKHAT